MNKQDTTAEDIRYLREIILRTKSGFQSNKKILIVWGIIIILSSILSQILVSRDLTGFIPLIWLPAVAAGTVLSIVIGRRTRIKQQMNSAVSRYMAVIWLGGTCVILSLFATGYLSPVFSLEYLPALSFPVIGLCFLITAALFRSARGYILAVISFLALIPAVIFPRYGLLMEAAIIGGGALIQGLVKDGKS